MTVKLRKVWLDGIGDPSARFTNVMFDFTDPAATLDTIVWLRNGGGKTSLLALMFSLVLPLQRDFLGGRDQERCLADYIQTGDTSHVVAEWETGHGTVVTGAVYEWPDRRRPAEPAKHQSELNKRWYAFQPSGYLDLTSLPVRTDGRRSTFEQYVGALKAIGKQRPGSIQVAATPAEWRAALDSFDIDQATFKYQKTMNRGEGSIDELFKFPTAEAFVDFIVELVVDDDGPAAFASNLRKVANKVASRPQKELERDFADGTATRLDPVAAAYTAHGRTTSDLEQLSVLAWTLQARIDAAARAAGVEANDANEALQAARAETARISRLRRAASARAADLRHLAAQLWVNEAKRHVAQLDELDKTAAVELAAWKIVERLIQAADADEAIRQIDAVFAQRAEGAEPLRVMRNEAARIALTALGAAATHAEAEAIEAEAEVAAADDEERSALEDAGEAAVKLRNAELREQSRKDTVERIEGMLASAVSAGLLDAGSDPADVVATRRAEDEALDGESTRIAQRAEALSVSIERIDRDRDAASNRATTAASEARRNEEQVEQLSADVDAIANHPRFRELAQTDQATLWAAGDNVIRRLDGEVTAAQARLVMLAVLTSRDLRNRTALGDGGLLPPSGDVEMILDVLANANILATHGLAFLSASVNRQRWDATIAAYPGLLAGVVVNDADYDRSCAAAIEAGLHPASLVCISRKRDVLAACDTATFVVPPSPALFDRQAADQERGRLDAVLSAYDGEQQAINAAIGADTHFRSRIETFLTNCPAGTVETLQRAAAEARRRESEAAGQLEALDRLRQEHVGEQRELTERAREVAERRRVLARQIARLDALAEQATDLPAARQQLEDVREEVGQARSAEDEARRSAAAASARSQTWGGRAAAAWGRHSALRSRSSTVTYAGDHDEGPATPDEGHEVSVDALVTAFERADAVWRNEVNDESLSAQRQQHVDMRRDALDGVPPDHDPITAVVTRLRATPVATTTAGRRDAVEVLEVERRRLAGERAVANNDVQAAQRELAQQPAPTGALDSEPLPTTRADADAARAAEEANAGRLRSAETEAENLVKEIGTNMETKRSRQQTMELLASGLENLVGRPAGVYPDDPFTGSEIQARSEVDELTNMVRQAKTAESKAKGELIAAHGRLRQFVTRAEFASLVGVADGTVRGELDTVGPHAATLAIQYRARAAVLTADLASIDADRDILVADLAGHVRSVLDMLKRAGRTLVLPDSMEAWAGKSFLTISFETCDDEELRRRLGVEVDQIVATGNAPEGISCLKRGVHAAVPKGFQARVFKPAAYLSDQRHPITRMGGWSGGEKLTAAVLLYCTLAKLRATRRRRHLVDTGAGVLILDNPLGKASYVGFVALQRRVAADLGVQLVYTTAVRDLGAVGQFPNVIRCRNGAPVGSQRSFVTVEERQGSAHGIEIGSGVVSAVSVARTDDYRQSGQTARQDDADDAAGVPAAG